MSETTAQQDERSEVAELEECSLESVFDQLSTDPQNGLSDDEAQRRLERYGRNTIEEEQESLLVRLLTHFWGPIPWMIEIAVVLSLVEPLPNQARAPA